MLRFVITFCLNSLIAVRNCLASKDDNVIKEVILSAIAASSLSFLDFSSLAARQCQIEENQPRNIPKEFMFTFRTSIASSNAERSKSYRYTIDTEGRRHILPDSLQKKMNVAVILHRCWKTKKKSRMEEEEE